MQPIRIRVLVAVVSACLLVLTLACDGNGRTFDPTQILDPASDSDGTPQVDSFDDDDAPAGDGDDDDDDADGHCNPSNSDEPDEYDDEMFPTGDDDDDDDDDDC